MNTIKKISAIALCLLFFASCGNSKKTSDSDSTQNEHSCACGNACSCNEDPCTCDHSDVAIDSTTANGDLIAFFNNGLYRYIKLNNEDASSAKLFDENKKEIAKGTLIKDSITTDKLVYNFDNGTMAFLYLQEPKLEIHHGNEVEEFVLIGPSQDVYTSGNDTIKAIYRPEVSVTLITSNENIVLPLKESHAKGADYSDGKISWMTQMNKARLIRNGKTIRYTTHGKSTLPKVVLSK